MTPVVIGLAIIALFTGAATIALPLIRESLGRSRRRRRSKGSKGRKTVHTPRQRLDIVAPPKADEGPRAGS